MARFGPRQARGEWPRECVPNVPLGGRASLVVGSALRQSRAQLDQIKPGRAGHRRPDLAGVPWISATARVEQLVEVGPGSGRGARCFGGALLRGLRSGSRAAERPLAALLRSARRLVVPSSGSGGTPAERGSARMRASPCRVRSEGRTGRTGQSDAEVGRAIGRTSAAPTSSPACRWCPTAFDR